MLTPPELGTLRQANMVAGVPLHRLQVSAVHAMGPMKWELLVHDVLQWSYCAAWQL